MPPAFPSRDTNSRTALAAEARLIALAITGASTLCAQTAGAFVEPAPGTAPEPAMYIREYRVLGSKHLPRIEVEEAVYPYLGPGRTFADVEQARAALEKAYHD